MQLEEVVLIEEKEQLVEEEGAALEIEQALELGSKGSEGTDSE